jgi:Flp pilus assembly protein TadD
MGGSVEQALRKARQYRRQGGRAQAVAVLSDLVRRYPGNRRARAALRALDTAAPPADELSQARTEAEALLAAGRPADALTRLTPLLDAGPASVPLHDIVAAALLRLGRPAAASDMLAAAARLQPDDPDLLLRLGAAACMAGRLADGVAAFRRAVACGAGARGEVRLGYAHLQSGEADSAVAAFSRATDMSPDDRDARFGLGEALHAQGDLPEAAVAYGRVLAAHPADPAALCNLGMVRVDMGDAEGAVAAFEAANALRPGDAGIVDNLAVARLAQGDFTAAAAAKRAALALDPMAADCARGFVPLAREDELDALATRFEAILASPAGGRPDGIKALHGLAEIAIRRGDRAGSVARLDAAAALHRCIWPLDPDRHEREFDALRAAFGDPAPMIDRPDPVPFTPVFIIGMPRSGTTLVEQLLTGHPDVAGAGETEALALAIRRTGGLDAPLTQARLAAIRSRYLAAIAAFRPGPVRLVTDKMPLNFRFVGVIAAAFPEARIIHLRRDAAAVCWSCYRACFRAAGLDFTYDQRRLGRYARGYAALMAHWRALLPDRLRMLDYAALTEAPEIEARALCADLGLAWDPAVLDLGRNHRPVRTASACQVRQPIYRGSSRAWRDYAPWLGPMLAALGR